MRLLLDEVVSIGGGVGGGFSVMSEAGTGGGGG
jgi:hypothetical protein